MTRKQFREGESPSVIVYSPYPESHACSYIRIVAPMRAARWNVMWASRQDGSGQLLDTSVARKADLILIQRQFPALSNEKVINALLRLGIPIVYDLDDMFLDVPTSHPSYIELSKRAAYVKWALNEVDLVTVSTSQLKESLGRHTSRPICVQPNLLDWNLFDAQPRRHDGAFRFLVSGTSTHRWDWALIEEPLAEILNRYRKVARAVFFGQLPKRFVGHPSVEFIDFEDRYGHYASRLRALDIHAALVPLEDNSFNQCKSNIKWLEYSAAGMPGAYSDLAPYQSSIRHGESGLLVNNTADAWFHAMDFLISNPEARSVMIDNARRQVREQYSVENLADKYTAIYGDLLGHNHRRDVSCGLSTLGSRLVARAHRAAGRSRFLGRHVTWRIGRKGSRD